ncbi:response regulator transcription factor [Liquorilactobacillus nagelii]|uniref:response regulator transcription factor n=1 Tax=Liquorilactobacillus nagelii TaxID=82688 RepID=UPI0006F1BAB2|nr:response regulator transcription factor [Liquorilactobacillus nagelii]KRL40947.1 DNA-binding response regulator [Liquorilactobacillus nagelii DSM 13675]QYH53901.1 response regulator transcription factor [Liquorilactobacillus nagelii DSM 13675]ULQ49518.1 response regulator transcription factor [Liquorilactobacillus nagelii]
MIKLYLAEDQSMLNSALTQLLELEDDFHVVGNAANGEIAWDDLQKLSVDVAILDIEMPKMTGLELASKIVAAGLKIKVIILTTFAQKAYFDQAVKAQVAGYLLKDSPSDELIEVIREVDQGQTIYDPDLVINMLTVDNNPLTKRELEVLQEIGRGLTTKEIAGKLFLTEGTIRNYLSAIFSKLGAKSRIEAIQIATRNGWV